LLADFRYIKQTTKEMEQLF
jgi:hypothetical protein